MKALNKVCRATAAVGIALALAGCAGQAEKDQAEDMSQETMASQPAAMDEASAAKTTLAGWKGTWNDFSSYLDKDEASIALQTTFGLSDRQATAIIQMRLGRLSHLETQQIIDELNELEIKIAFYNELLSDEAKMLAEVEKEIRAVGEEYGDDRRTFIDIHEIDGLVDRDFIKKEDVVVVITNKDNCLNSVFPCVDEIV